MIFLSFLLVIGVVCIAVIGTGPKAPHPAQMAFKPEVVLGAIVGGLLGLTCAAAGVLLGGGGHGWLTGFLFGVMALALSPLAFMRLAHGRKLSLRKSRRLVIIALVLDLLFLLSVAHEWRSFLRFWQGALMWLALWLPWQFAALASWLLTRHTRYSVEREHQTS